MVQNELWSPLRSVIHVVPACVQTTLRAIQQPRPSMCAIPHCPPRDYYLPTRPSQSSKSASERRIPEERVTNARYVLIVEFPGIFCDTVTVASTTCSVVSQIGHPVMTLVTGVLSTIADPAVHRQLRSAVAVQDHPILVDHDLLHSSMTLLCRSSRCQT